MDVTKYRKRTITTPKAEEVKVEEPVIEILPLEEEIVEEETPELDLEEILDDEFIYEK